MANNGTAQSGGSTLPRMKCSEVTPGDRVESVYLLSSADQRAKKNGDPFFSLTMRDSTGTLNGVMWDNHADLVAGKVKSDDFVVVQGHASEYNGAVQVTVQRLQKVDDNQVEVADFLAVSPRPRAEMERELDALIESVVQPDCRRLLDVMFGSATLRELYCTAPAAARIHQAYIHGLLEHTLNVVRNALELAERYGDYDRDLLVAAGLLHDVGKIREYDWRRSITYTDDGRLVGHIPIGAIMVDGYIRDLKKTPEGFSDHYRRHILHLILSHHGKMEFGSPVIPKTKEAFILHYADYNDAFLTSFNDAVRGAQESGEPWTPYNRMFETFLFSGASSPSPPSPRPSLPPEVPASAQMELDPREMSGSARGNLDDPSSEKID
ncbi:HD domain-containing protein [bacterium]|nr:HD domain-containing protein [bacterium]